MKIRLGREFIQSMALNLKRRQFPMTELAAHKVHKRSAQRFYGDLRVQDTSSDLRSAGQALLHAGVPQSFRLPRRHARRLPPATPEEEQAVA